MSRQPSPGAPAGVFLELSVPAPDDDRFHQWHEQVNIPARTSSPGVRNALRYRDVQDPNTWLTRYDLDAAAGDLITSAAAMPPTLQDVPIRLPRYEQRQYRRIDVPESADELAAGDDDVLMAVWWTPSADAVEDFHAWYRQEHIPMLMQVPGWRAIRRYALLAGTGPGFLAMHFLASADVLEHPAHRRAGATPWRAASATHRIQHERRVFRRARTPAGEADGT